jgi:hypothetical protein
MENMDLISCVKDIMTSTTTPACPTQACQTPLDSFLNIFFPSFDTTQSTNTNKKTYNTKEYFVIDLFSESPFPDKEGKFIKRDDKTDVYGEKVIRRVVETDPYTKLLSDIYQVEAMMNFLTETGSNLQDESLHKPKYTAKLSIDEVVSKQAFVNRS